MSPTGSALADWLVKLESFSPHEIELGLDRVREVWERLEVAPPERVFLVGGTNGKGSSVALLAALLGQSGASVATYTSPHVHAFNERICIDGQFADDAAIISAFERIEGVRDDTPLTYFEFGTLAAMLVFVARGVDIAVLEVGMGGRLDAVNIFEPTASLITNVSLDHSAWLGNTVEAIAFEKAGIMRPGKPVVFASSTVPQAIAKQAGELGAKLLLAGRDYRWDGGDTWTWRGRQQEIKGLQRPGLPGRFQLDNAAGVLALVEAAGLENLLRADIVNAAFSGIELAGRMQQLRLERNWLIDVAHNPAAAEVLAESLAGDGFAGKTIALVGMLDDKDVEGVIRPLATAVDAWIAVTANSPRALEAAELARRVANVVNGPCVIGESISGAIAEAHQRTGSDNRILVFGSFFVVGPVLEALGLYSSRKGDS